jgi:hypothetical protein
LFEPVKQIGFSAVDGSTAINGRLYGLQSPSLHVQISLNVYFEGLLVSMAQDVFNGDGLDASLKQMHGLGVTAMSLKT